MTGDGRVADRRGYRWGRTAGKVAFHGSKVAIERPRVRAHGGGEVTLAQSEDCATALGDEPDADQRFDAPL
jgi:hypothetical protein